MGTMLSLYSTYSIFGTKYKRRNQFPEISLIPCMKIHDVHFSFPCVHGLRLSSFLFSSGSVSSAIFANILFYFTCCFLNNLNFLVVSYRARDRASGGASDDDNGGTSGRARGDASDDSGGASGVASGRASASGGAIALRTRSRTNNSR